MSFVVQSVLTYVGSWVLGKEIGDRREPLTRLPENSVFPSAAEIL